MARPLSWSDVRGGAIAVLALLLIVFATMKYSRLGVLRGETFRLYALVSEARGLLVGSEVWLSGQKIGKVLSIDFRTPSLADTTARLELELEVLEEYRGLMRRNAIAQIRAGGSMVGAPVVYISPGTPASAPLMPRDTLRAAPQSDFEGAAGMFAEASQDFPAIIGNIRTLSRQLQGNEGTIGAVLGDDGRQGVGEVARLRAGIGRLGASLSGQGTAGRVMQGGLQARVGTVLARVDSLRALAASPGTSLGRFRRDSTLLENVAEVREELTRVRGLLDEPRGTVGRVMQDSAVTNALAEAQRQMTLLFADIKKHPFRYLSF